MRLTSMDKERIKIVAQQLTAEKLFFSQDETEGAKWFAAIEKAETEILFNKSISFQNGVLKFVSRDSRETRIVTAFGCSQACPCKNGVSYHAAMYQILHAVGIELRAEPSTAKLPAFEGIYTKRDLSGAKAEYCGGIRI